jgi:hypothetical protein
MNLNELIEFLSLTFQRLITYDRSYLLELNQDEADKIANKIIKDVEGRLSNEERIQAINKNEIFYSTGEDKIQNNNFVKKMLKDLMIKHNGRIIPFPSPSSSSSTTKINSEKQTTENTIKNWFTIDELLSKNKENNPHLMLSYLYHIGVLTNAKEENSLKFVGNVRQIFLNNE